MEAKNLFASKTVWFNVLTVIVVLATLFGYTPNQELATDVSTILTALNPVINILLRLVTKQPVKL